MHITAFVAILLLAQAPLPTKLVDAKTALLVNAGTKQEWVDKLATDLAKTKRFEIVADEEKADIIIRLADNKSGSVTVPVSGVFVSADVEGFTLSIVDAGSKTPLWSDHEQVSWTRGGAVSALVKRLDKRLGKKR